MLLTNLISFQRNVSSVRVTVHDIDRFENTIFIPDADGNDPSTNSDSCFESRDFIIINSNGSNDVPQHTTRTRGNLRNQMGYGWVSTPDKNTMD